MQLPVSSKVGAAGLAAIICPAVREIVEAFTDAVPGGVWDLKNLLLVLLLGYIVKETRPSPSAETSLISKGWQPPSN